MSEHLRLPFSLTANGTFATVQEDTDSEVVQNVAVILRTRQDERLATPRFGTADPTFTGLDPAQVLPVVGEYEPRATLRIVQAAIRADGVQTNDIGVRRQES